MQDDDFEMPCGCKRITHRNSKGEIDYIDEAMCAEHLRPMWGALPALSRKFPVITLENKKEKE